MPHTEKQAKEFRTLIRKAEPPVVVGFALGIDASDSAVFVGKQKPASCIRSLIGLSRTTKPLNSGRVIWEDDVLTLACQKTPDSKIKKQFFDYFKRLNATLPVAANEILLLGPDEWDSVKADEIDDSGGGGDDSSDDSGPSTDLGDGSGQSTGDRRKDEKEVFKDRCRALMTALAPYESKPNAELGWTTAQHDHFVALMAQGKMFWNDAAKGEYAQAFKAFQGAVVIVQASKPQAEARRTLAESLKKIESAAQRLDARQKKAKEIQEAIAALGRRLPEADPIDPVGQEITALTDRLKAYLGGMQAFKAAAAKSAEGQAKIAPLAARFPAIAKEKAAIDQALAEMNAKAADGDWGEAMKAAQAVDAAIVKMGEALPPLYQAAAAPDLMETRMLAGPDAPPALAAAKKAVRDARVAANAFAAAGEWVEAFAALDEIPALVLALMDAYGIKAEARGADFAARAANKGAVMTAPGIAALKTRTAFLAAQKIFAGFVAKKDFVAALGEVAKVEAALVKLEALTIPDDAAKQKMVADAAKLVTDMPETDLAAKTHGERAGMIFDLIANGPPSGDAKAAIHKIYRNTKVDPKFIARRKEERKQIARRVAKIPNADTVKQNWTTLGPDDRTAFLKLVQNEQSAEFGIPEVPITAVHKAPVDGRILFGEYMPHTRDIELNTHPSAMPTFREAVNSTLHENTHAQQHILADRLYDGTLTPDDDRYEQVLMLAVNNEDAAYVPDSEDPVLYKAQPMEEDAWREGDEGSQLVSDILDGLVV